MARFPLYVDLTRRRVLLAGGGRMALHKAEVLLQFGAAVQVVSPQALPALKALAAAGKLNWRQAPYQTEDLTDAVLAVAATNDRQVNRQISIDAQARGIPVNVVDDPALCTFYFPALVQRGDLVIGISTGGSFPAFARYARQKIALLFPERCGRLLQTLKRDREKIHREISDPAERRTALEKRLAQVLQTELPDAAFSENKENPRTEKGDFHANSDGGN